MEQFIQLGSGEILVLLGVIVLASASVSVVVQFLKEVYRGILPTGWQTQHSRLLFRGLSLVLGIPVGLAIGSQFALPVVLSICLGLLVGGLSETAYRWLLKDGIPMLLEKFNGS